VEDTHRNFWVDQQQSKAVPNFLGWSTVHDGTKATIGLVLFSILDQLVVDPPNHNGYNNNYNTNLDIPTLRVPFRMGGDCQGGGFGV